MHEPAKYYLDPAGIRLLVDGVGGPYGLVVDPSVMTPNEKKIFDNLKKERDAAEQKKAIPAGSMKSVETILADTPAPAGGATPENPPAPANEGTPETQPGSAVDGLPPAAAPGISEEDAQAIKMDLDSDVELNRTSLLHFINVLQLNVAVPVGITNKELRENIAAAYNAKYCQAQEAEQAS